jgi:protein-S-isoprenylcysteine O-methyltransferase Ste14
MKLKELVGAGDWIVGITLPFAVLGNVANKLWPGVFRMCLGLPGLIVGIVLLAVGVPVWLFSVMQILRYVPRGRLITTGPFALVLHPLYTSVAMLVIPGCGFVLDTWLGPALGLILYGASRIFAGSEETLLSVRFPEEYSRYRQRVQLPWL